MKKFNCVLLLSLALMLIVGCAKDNLFAPADDQEAPSLKSEKVKRTFTGICTNVLTTNEVNEWYDATDDWRVTGTTFWTEEGDVPDGYDFAGTAVLIVDAKNKHDENRGIWEMTWKGTITPIGENLLLIVAIATGEGIEGKVKGMNANWTYTMNWDTTNPETYFYVIEGNIDKPQGPIKK
jgi:hypothetical protein